MPSVILFALFITYWWRRFGRAYLAAARAEQSADRERRALIAARLERLTA